MKQEMIADLGGSVARLGYIYRDLQKETASMKNPALVYELACQGIDELVRIRAIAAKPKDLALVREFVRETDVQKTWEKHGWQKPSLEVVK